MRDWLVISIAASAPLAVTAPAQAQTLAEALDSAYRTNPTLAQARADSQGAEEGFVQARAGLLPRISLSGTYGLRDTETTIETPAQGPTVSSQDLEPRSYGVNITQPLYQGGRLRALTRSADASAKAAEQGLRSVEQGVLLAAVAAYTDVRRDMELVRIRGNDVEVLSRQLQAARDRFEVGEITRTDVAQAEARLSRAQASLAAGRSTLEASRANFTQVIGLGPDQLEAPPPPPAVPESLDAAMTQALASNPSVLQALQGERAAKAGVNVAAAGLKPSISLVGSLNKQYDFNQVDREDEVTQATAQVSIPLFETGLNQSRLRAAKLGLRSARAALDEARRAVTADVTGAWNDYIAAAQVLEASIKQEEAAALALEGVEEELKVGLRTTLDVLDAQQEALLAQLAIANAERDTYVAAHALLASVGGLTPQALGVNEGLYDPSKVRSRVRTTILNFGPVDQD